MKSLTVRFLLLGCLTWVIGVGVVRAETPKEAVDRVWNAFISIDPKQNQDLTFPPFINLTKKIAKEQGVAVIDPIMVRSKDWKGEEVLIFANLVCCLPPEKAIPILKQYEKDGKPWERQCATDLLADINDMQESQKTVKVNVIIPGR